MNIRMVWFKALCAAALLALVLAACLEATPQDLHRSLKLEAMADTDYETINVEIEVGPDGTKYMAWTECNASSHCIIAITWTKTGKMATRFVLPVGGSNPSLSYFDPDLAVTDSGSVYLVWTQRAAGEDPEDCWAMFNPAAPGTSITCQPLNTTAFLNRGISPLVAAGGNTVYAVYGVRMATTENNKRGLRYRRLSHASTPREGWVNEDGVSDAHTHHSYPALAVSGSGELYVSWIEYSINRTEEPFDRYHFACMIGGVPTRTSAALPGVNVGIHPVVVIAPDQEDVAVAYTANQGSNVMVLAYTTGCAYRNLDLILPGGEGWVITSHPTLSYTGSDSDTRNLSVAFAGRNSTVTGDSEIWVKEVDFTNDPDPARVTDNDWDDVLPLMAPIYEEGGLNYSYVLTWRVGTPMGFGDIYLLKPLISAPQKIFDGVSEYSQVDLASDGGIWVGGIWISNRDTLASRRIAWATFNDWEFYIPELKKEH